MEITPELTAKLNEFATLGDDWDGYGSAEPSAETLATMRRLLLRFPQHDEIAVHLDPFGIAFTWGIVEMYVDINHNGSFALWRGIDMNSNEVHTGDRGCDPATDEDFDMFTMWFLDKIAGFRDMQAEAKTEMEKWDEVESVTDIWFNSPFRPLTYAVRMRDPNVTHGVGWIWQNFRASHAYGSDDRRAFFRSSQIINVSSIVNATTED